MWHTSVQQKRKQFITLDKAGFYSVQLLCIWPHLMVPLPENEPSLSYISQPQIVLHLSPHFQWWWESPGCRVLCMNTRAKPFLPSHDAGFAVNSTVIQPSFLLSVQPHAHHMELSAYQYVTTVWTTGNLSSKSGDCLLLSILPREIYIFSNVLWSFSENSMPFFIFS